MAAGMAILTWFQESSVGQVGIIAAGCQTEPLGGLWRVLARGAVWQVGVSVLILHRSVSVLGTRSALLL